MTAKAEPLLCVRGRGFSGGGLVDVDCGYLIAWVIVTAMGASIAFLVTWSPPVACAVAVLLWLAAGVLAWADRE